MNRMNETNCSDNIIHVIHSFKFCVYKKCLFIGNRYFYIGTSSLPFMRPRHQSADIGYQKFAAHWNYPLCHESISNKAKFEILHVG